MIKSILFDMDGVLIDAREWHYDALNKALELFGMPISRYDHCTIFDGLPTLKKLEILSIDHDLPRALHSFISEMKQRYTTEMVHTRCKPRFAQEQALSLLKAKGYRTAVCSNSIRSTVELMMQKANLATYLDVMVSNEDVSRPKPDPEMYLKAMSELGLPPDECLIVEDNENGIRAARASGGHLLVVDSVEQTNAEHLFSRIHEIDHTAATSVAA